MNFKRKDILVKPKVNIARVLHPMLLFNRLAITSVAITLQFVPI